MYSSPKIIEKAAKAINQSFCSTAQPNQAIIPKREISVAEREQVGILLFLSFITAGQMAVNVAKRASDSIIWYNMSMNNL